MKKLAILSILLALTALLAAQAQKHSKAPPVLKGSIASVDGNIIVLSGMAAGVPNGRQIDVSKATFEGSDGRAVARYPLRANDVVIVVIDPDVPTEWRPKPRPGRPMPMLIRLLPLKAMVVERLLHGPDPTSIKP